MSCPAAMARGGGGHAGAQQRAVAAAPEGETCPPPRPGRGARQVGALLSAAGSGLAPPGATAQQPQRA